LRKEVIDLGKITVISDQYLGIRGVFDRLYYERHESVGEVVQHFCTQHITQNVYEVYHMKRIKTIFKQATRHKKL
jgi:hypothetical protein